MEENKINIETRKYTEDEIFRICSSFRGLEVRQEGKIYICPTNKNIWNFSERDKHLLEVNNKIIRQSETDILLCIEEDDKSFLRLI